MRTTLNEELATPMRPELAHQLETEAFAGGRPEIGSEAFWEVMGGENGLTADAALTAEGLAADAEATVPTDAELVTELDGLTEELKSRAELEPAANSRKGAQRLDLIVGKHTAK